MNTTHSDNSAALYRDAATAVASRFDLAAVFARRRPELRKAFGPFCAGLERLDLSLNEWRVGVLVAKASLLRGFNLLALRPISQLVAPDGRELIEGKGKNDVSPALERLDDLGVILYRKYKAEKVSLVLVFADPLAWRGASGAVLFTREQEAAWLGAHEALRGAQSPFLAGLAPDADLLDALAHGGAVSGKGESASGKLKEERTAIDAVVRGAANFERPVRSSFLVEDAGARKGETERERAELRSCSASRSEIQNAKGPMKSGFSPPDSESQNALTIERKGSARASKLGSLPMGRAMSREDCKAALGGDEREFCAAAREIIGRRDWDDGRPEHWQGDGSKWRMRWRHGPSRETVRAVFREIMERPGHCQAALAQVRWVEFGGVRLDEMRMNSKESL